MGSPFPGMDPYLERRWRDVHTKFVTYAADALNAFLPKDLVARTEESLGIEADDSGLPPAVSPDEPSLKPQVLAPAMVQCIAGDNSLSSGWLQRRLSRSRIGG